MTITKCREINYQRFIDYDCSVPLPLVGEKVAVSQWEEKVPKSLALELDKLIKKRKNGKNILR